MANKYVQNWKMTNFYIYFLNMDISLIIIVTFLKLFTHDAMIHLEGSYLKMLGFSFCFIV